MEWDAFDVLSPEGARVEVKSAGYLQAWAERSPSRISFGSMKGRTWTPESGWSEGAILNADVWTVPGSRRVIGFYSIKPTQVTAASVSRGIAGGHNVVPGWLLARLALHCEVHGSGYGGQLLRDALESCVAAVRHGAGRVIIVATARQALGIE